jgi:hypothetical protein
MFLLFTGQTIFTLKILISNILYLDISNYFGRLRINKLFFFITKKKKKKMKRISQPSVLKFFEKKKKSESINDTNQIIQPSSLFVLTDPEVSNSPENVSSVEAEQELSYKNDVGIYLGNPQTDNEKKN